VRLRESIIIWKPMRYFPFTVSTCTARKAPMVGFRLIPRPPCASSFFLRELPLSHSA
jgi:hypothetical protein